MADTQTNQTWDEKANTTVNNAVQKAGNVAGVATKATGQALGVGANAVGAGVKMAGQQVGNILKPVANAVAPVAQKVANVAQAAQPAVAAYAAQQAHSQAKGIQAKNENLEQGLAEEFDRFAAENRENKQKRNLEANKSVDERTGELMSVEAREKGDAAMNAAGAEGQSNPALRLQQGKASAEPAREFAQKEKENAQNREETARNNEAGQMQTAAYLRQENDDYAVADAYNADVAAQEAQAEAPGNDQAEPAEQPPPQQQAQQPPQQQQQTNDKNAKDIVSKGMPPEALAILGDKPRFVTDDQLKQINEIIVKQGGTRITPSTELQQGDKGVGVGGRWWPGQDSSSMKLASQHNQTTTVPTPSPPVNNDKDGSDVRIKDVKKPKKGTTNGVAIDPNTEYEAALKEMATVLASHRGFY